MYNCGCLFCFCHTSHTPPASGCYGLQTACLHLPYIIRPSACLPLPQTTWKNVQEAVGGMGLRQPLELPHCRAMAAVCPELVTVQEHHRRARPRAGGIFCMPTRLHVMCGCGVPPAA